ncbi:MAG: SpoVA/SpoVAEb family sporulation membrane protein [Firmicutes bacterium]|jgi:stage V sporulation protein AE|nr:SpoVA/SpoVAEb family sporulation membrane protein [Bacillota bacterium]
MLRPSKLNSGKRGVAVSYVIAFVTGGLICAAAQLVLEYTNLTPAHVLVGLTVLGAILGGIGVYEPFLQVAGAGALVPVSGFGSSIAKGMLSEIKRLGWEGLFTGAFEITGLGLAAAVVFGSLVAVAAKPRD